MKQRWYGNEWKGGLLGSAMRALSATGLAVTVLAPAAAHAQASSGKLQGKAVDASSKKALSEAVVTVTSPSMQGEQTLLTDETGEFFLPALQPGAYKVHIEKEGFKPFNQDGVVVRLGQTIRVTFSLVPDALQAEEIVVDARPPTVDVGSTQAGVTVTPEFIQNLPIVSSNRSFESLAATAPTAEGDDYGVSIGGSTSPENNFVIDGVRVTDPSVGVNASSLSVDFVKEVQVVTGGYMPEFGRSTGGVVNVVTKSGGNDFHGSVTLDLQPGLLTALAKEIQQPGSAISTDNQNLLTGNLSAELGGPIIKDKLWFFAGAQLGYHQDRSTRHYNTVAYQKGCPVDENGKLATSPDATVGYSADVTGCKPEEQGVLTDAEGNPKVASIDRIKGPNGESFDETFDNVRRDLQFMGKLTYAVTPNHTLTATGWINTVGATGPGTGNLKGDMSYYDTKGTAFVGDYSLRWNGAFLDKKLLVEALAGWHHQSNSSESNVEGAGDLAAVLWDRPHSLVEFAGTGTRATAVLSACGEGDAALDYKRCPLTNYRTGGPGALDVSVMDRLQARIAGTYLLNAFGKHELKVGADYESMTFDLTKRYSGTVALREGRTTWTDYRRYGYLEGPDKPVFLDSIRNVTGSGSFAGFAQDSWRPNDLVTLNFGLRWENQSMYGGTNTDQLGGQVMSFNNNWMPRVGLILDPTRSGRSKVFASYGWFYETLSLDMMDRQFPAEKQIVSLRKKFDPTKPEAGGCDPTKADNIKKGGSCQAESTLRGNPYAQAEEPNQIWTPTGGASTPVDPNLSGQRMSELAMGGEYEVVPEARLGVAYTHRQIDRIIEDLSNDGGATYFLANPGEGLAKDFPKPQRNYDGFTAYFNRSWSKAWLLQASYTLSFLYGNYAGLFRPETGQLDPNITSDYDLKKLLANRTGYLPGDHRHSLKVFGSREIALAERHKLILGAGVNVLSGAPTNYLGSDDTYGPNESYILPRGSGDRLPTTFTTDIAVKYGYVVRPESVFTVGLDIYNLFNTQNVSSVDERYTDDNVKPISGGQASDLANLHPNEAPNAKVTKNPNFGQATSYTAPLAARILVRWTF